MSERPVLKSVGYWHGGSFFDQLPRPQRLVRKRWHYAEMHHIVTYLRSGYCFSGWMGYSYCRFNCKVDDKELGYTDLTDGEWLWPAGLFHYVETHEVMLPATFVNTMRRNEWRIPELNPPPEMPNPDHFEIDASFWLEWSRHHQRRPW